VVPAADLTAQAEAAQVRARTQEDVSAQRAEAQAARAEAERAGFEAGKQAGLAQVSTLLLAARAQAEQDLARAKDAAIVLARRMAERIVVARSSLRPS